MNIVLRLSFGLISTLIPLASAAMPANVTSLTAQRDGNGVIVQWDAPADDIAFYKVFLSTQSILQNGGLYDEVEQTPDSATTYRIRNVLDGDELFIAVLAVNEAGEESEFFVEETSVTLDDMQADDSALRMLSVESVSATMVEVRFSHPLNAPQNPQELFSIRSGNGTELPITKLTIEGGKVTIETGTQRRKAPYLVEITGDVTGQGSNGQALALDQLQTPLLFIGHDSGLDADDLASLDVQDLQLTAAYEGNGTYAVDAVWTAPAAGNIVGYQISQTTDRGARYSGARMVRKDVDTTLVRGVPIGSFGILVRAQRSDGSLSPGILQLIELPAPKATAAPTASVTQREGSVLSESGTQATVLALAIFAGLIGWKMWRKQLPGMKRA